MIAIFIDLLKEWGINLGFLRLFSYITFRTIMAMATSLLITLLLGFRFIVFLYRYRFRDTSNIRGSIDTSSKAGTPTSGGILIVLSTFLSILLWSHLSNIFVIISIIALFYFAFIGLVDDWQKIKYKTSLLGLSQKMKTFLMLIFIIPFAIFMASPLSPLPYNIRTDIFVPFYKYSVLDMGFWGYLIFIIFVFFSVVNSINITDGMDGLLSGTAGMTIGVYGVFSYIIGNRILASHYLFYYIPGLGEQTIVLGAVIGSLLGFLWYNSYPAEIFMGDTGSLSIGAVISVTLFFTKQEFLFLIAGAIFVFEILSSFLQEKVGNNIGRRIFYRAPIHHSFTHRGIAEPKTVIRFWILALLCAFIALITIKIR